MSGEPRPRSEPTTSMTGFLLSTATEGEFAVLDLSQAEFDELLGILNRNKVTLDLHGPMRFSSKADHDRGLALLQKGLATGAILQREEKTSLPA